MNCLTPIPEEWLVERDWLIVNHWEDQFCRDVYQNLCEFVEFQHLRAVAQLKVSLANPTMESSQIR